MVEKRRLSRRTALVSLAGAAAGTIVLPALPAAAAKPQASVLTMLPLQITDVIVQNGQLVAQGLIGSTPISLPLTLSFGPLVDGIRILNLQIGAINLDLLGLNVTTSPICLAINAQAINGLLATFLGSIAVLLGQDQTLGQILSAYTPEQLNILLTGLAGVLGAVFGLLTSGSAVVGAGCPVLNLALGPVDLTLLGLNVHLDNCSNGPVTLDITALPGPGALLGNLLCSLANVLNGPASGTAVAALLRNISREIARLLA